MTVEMTSFAGADTPIGFVSCFENLFAPIKDRHLYILKGGPGTGKSTFLRRIAEYAERKTMGVERVMCAADPRSLDAVRIPELGLVFADRTAPHYLETVYTGVCSSLLDLGRFLNREKLSALSEHIVNVSEEEKVHRARAGHFLKAAGMMHRVARAESLGRLDWEKMKAFVKRQQTNLKPTEDHSVRRRFLSVFTAEGFFTCKKKLATRFGTRIAVVDHGGTAEVLLRLLYNSFRDKGIAMEVYHSPLDPEIGLEALAIPGMDVCWYIAEDAGEQELVPTKQIHMKRFWNGKSYALTPMYRSALRCRKQFLNEAADSLAAAGASHSVLEAAYMSAMDFNGADQMLQEILLDIDYRKDEQPDWQ